MLSISLNKFDRACGPTTGGISRAWIADRDDFTFTQAVATAAGKPAYSAIARRPGATTAGGAFMFPVKFERKTAEYRYTQSKPGSSVKYEHFVEFLLPDLGQFITNWNEKIDAAGICNGILIILELNTGKILVLGEKWVGMNAIPEWEFAQDGASGTSGKLQEDSNGHTAILKGDYGRGAYEFSGGASAVMALEEQEESGS